MSILIVADIILSGINSVQEIFYWFYRVSLVLGYCILLIVFRIFEACRVVVYTISEAFKILNDDFDIFLRDIGSILLSVWVYINEALSKCATTVLQITRESTSIFCNVFLAFFSFFENDFYQNLFLHCVLKPSELIFGALCLIGQTASHIVKTVWTCIENIPKLPQLALSYLKKRSVNLGHYVLYILTHEAMYGFLLVSAVSYFSYKSRLCHKLGYICQKVLSSVCLITFDYMLTFISKVCIFLRKIKIKKGINRTPNDINLFNRDELQKQLEKEKAEKLCIVCMDSKRNAMLLNCKHLVLCNDCAYTILDYHRTCPVCRCYVAQVIPVYT